MFDEQGGFMKFFKNKKDREREEQERLAELARLEEERKIAEERLKKVSIINKTRIGFGIFFIFAGIIQLFDLNVLCALCSILFGISITPYFDSIVKQMGYNMNIGIRITIPVLLFFGIGVFAPPSEPSNTTTMDVDKEAVVETITPTATLTELPVETVVPTPTVKPTPTATPTATVEVSQDSVTEAESDSTYVVSQKATISADACDLSGWRQANAVVDIGYGDRVYWAYTNEYGQLVKVVADEIILQTAEEESSNGRYCSDEAKVPGTEDSDLDEGHVIADSLGGVSNAYNITPQNSTLNRHGDQAYMEDTIRDAGGATNFVAEITYPNTETQIPSHYKYTYTVWGNVVVDEFDNVNPDDTIPNYNEGSSSNNTSSSSSNNSTNTNNNYDAPQPPAEQPTYSEPQGNMVWKSATGSKYHSINNCGKMNPAKATQLTEGDAIAQGLERCSKCW